jgi:hypothetical protein
MQKTEMAKPAHLHEETLADDLDASTPTTGAFFFLQFPFKSPNGYFTAFTSNYDVIEGTITPDQLETVLYKCNEVAKTNSTATLWCICISFAVLSCVSVVL